ncbi:xylose operon transcription regulator XylR [Rhodopirellula sp. MGV]|uniref:AraC family transcriptional regulator n=1 Tax=Rhodopirellula sp. MGV TaxID=2023130 RepID=UPI000B96328C|nr:DNA-binding transcriptional regulator [Rhodopirellula sp. MGV]OYP37071.1 XylR family transcriptional regulator [Rhodopirellula sp. MGV]PNY36166.1 XylR family transcriptional regulator [Rhodopirellula baltica]
MAKKRKSVALLIETSNAYARGVLRGIASYVHEHEQWSIFLTEQERGSLPPSWLQDWNGHGVIARIENQATAQVVQDLKIPVVDVSAARHIPEIPCVETDDEAIAGLAYTHLRERGFETFGFCGDARFVWSTNREKAFLKRVEEDGFPCSTFVDQRQSRRAPGAERRRLVKWLHQLPKPIGIFATYDIKAQEVLDACRECDLKVPLEVAVLGVDNDELLCDLCTPPLTSIAPDAEQAGRVAAATLDAMMNKPRRQCGNHPSMRLLPPKGIVSRQSTDIVAISDKDVAEAVRFIRDHYCEPINVQDLLERIPISRRMLESRFREILGRTPHQEILRRRIDQIQYLLANTDLSLSQIARQTGFQNQEYMSVAFRRAVGQPPGAFRKERRRVSQEN